MSFGVGVTLHETRHFLAEFSFVDVIKWKTNENTIVRSFKPPAQNPIIKQQKTMKLRKKDTELKMNQIKIKYHIKAPE